MKHKNSCMIQVVSFIENDFTTEYKLAMIKWIRLEQSRLRANTNTKTWYNSENWTDISRFNLIGIRFSRDTPQCTLRVMKMVFRGSTRPKSKITTINFYLHWNHYVISGYLRSKIGNQKLVPFSFPTTCKTILDS